MVKGEYEAVLKKVEKTTTDFFFVTERPRNARPSNKIEWRRQKHSVRETLEWSTVLRVWQQEGCGNM
jgi:hypothetical protein